MEQGAKTGSATILSTNLHQVGEHFIESISEVESVSLVEGIDPDRTEDPNQLLQNIRFKVTIRDGVTGPINTASPHFLICRMNPWGEEYVRTKT